jgi:hypothetical protein
MVIIWADEGYITDTVMIEASEQRVVKFWPAYQILQEALAKDATLWYGLEELFNIAFKDNSYIYTENIITTQPAYRTNNPNNSTQQQNKDYHKSHILFPPIHD